MRFFLCSVTRLAPLLRQSADRVYDTCRHTLSVVAIVENLFERSIRGEPDLHDASLEVVEVLM